MKEIALGFICSAVLTGLILTAQKKPAPVKTVEPCAPTLVQEWPNGRDPSLDWVRALNNLHSRLDQLEKKFDARPAMDPEIEDMHRQLLGRKFPVYEGTVSGKPIVLVPK